MNSLDEQWYRARGEKIQEWFEPNKLFSTRPDRRIINFVANQLNAWADDSDWNALNEGVMDVIAKAPDYLKDFGLDPEYVMRSSFERGRWAIAVALCAIQGTTGELAREQFDSLVQSKMSDIIADWSPVAEFRLLQNYGPIAGLIMERFKLSPH